MIHLTPLTTNVPELVECLTQFFSSEPEQIRDVGLLFSQVSASCEVYMSLLTVEHPPSEAFATFHVSVVSPSGLDFDVDVPARELTMRILERELENILILSFAGVDVSFHLVQGVMKFGHIQSHSLTNQSQVAGKRVSRHL